MKIFNQLIVLVLILVVSYLSTIETAGCGPNEVVYIQSLVRLELLVSGPGDTDLAFNGTASSFSGFCKIAYQNKTANLSAVNVISFRLLENQSLFVTVTQNKTVELQHRTVNPATLETGHLFLCKHQPGGYISLESVRFPKFYLSKARKGGGVSLSTKLRSRLAWFRMF